MKHIVSFSGGLGSWVTAKLVKEKVGVENMILLFTDTLMEDEDLYRFLFEGAENIGCPLICIKDGRNPWALFMEQGMMGNTRVDMCSRILKRELSDSWIESRFSPEECIVYLGIDWAEVHRYERTVKRKQPYIYKAPLTEPPYLSKGQLKDILKAEGIELPRLYKMGFEHNNCGGFCVKAGHAHFKILHRELPERYKFHEEMEERFRAHVGKDVAILRDRRGGDTRGFTFKEFREEKLEGPGQIDEFDFGGCGCFLD